MLTRRQFLARGSALAGLAAGTTGLLALTRDKLPDGSASKGMITPAADRAIRDGLAYLASNQDANGSFGTNRYKGNVAVSSLAAMAFMAGGHLPGRGKYGKNVNLALKYVLSQERDNPVPGYLCDNPGGAFNGLHGPMYGHGFGTLFLGEVYGMVQNKEMRDKLRGTLRKAVKLIVNTQNTEGGWRYQPQPAGADISVTICQIMALRSARNAGIAVPKSTVDGCIKYVKDCRNADGGYRYTKGGWGGASGFARTAAGVSALYSAGVYEGQEVEGGLNYMLTKFKPGHVTVGADNMAYNEYRVHYFYGHYYAAQDMWTAGGKYWAEWFPALREDLLANNERRRSDHWEDRICAHYATAMALIALQIPNNYLPILQK
jgi:hypothetical protein